MTRRKTWEEHVEDFKKVHGGRYEYPAQQVLDRGNATKVKVVCKEHGEFDQFIYSHKNGSGCPYCAGKKLKSEGSKVLCEDGLTRVIISRKNARSQGFERCFTGKPCKAGHISERYVSTGACVACAEEYRQENRETIEEYKKEYRQANRESIAKYWKEYYQANREAINEYRRNLYATDEDFKVSRICRRFLERTLKATSSTKDSQTYEALGYCNEQLHQNISQKLIDGMSWDNYGVAWHIDHVVPVSRYINEHGITDPAIINNLNNLIPLYAEHNLEKSARTLEEYLDDNPDLYDTYGHFLKEQRK